MSHLFVKDKTTGSHTEAQSEGGRLTTQSLLVGSNDINGGAPHRHLTIDGNGRLLTYPYQHPNSWTNTHLTSIRDLLRGETTTIWNEGDIGDNYAHTSVNAGATLSLSIDLGCW